MVLSALGNGSKKNCAHLSERGIDLLMFEFVFGNCQIEASPLQKKKVLTCMNVESNPAHLGTAKKKLLKKNCAHLSESGIKPSLCS